MMRVLTFDSTHYALLAEQIALENGFGVQITPAPPDAGAGCDLALEYFAEDEDRLAALLTSSDVVFRSYVRPLP